MKKTKRSNRRLQRIRLGLPLGIVARHFKGGCSPQRIWAIEGADRVETETEDCYRQALVASLAELKKQAEVFARVRKELQA